MKAALKPLYTPIPVLTTLACIILAILFGLYYPLADVFKYPINLFGIIPIIIAVYIFISFGKLFYKHKTTVRPGEIPSSLITEVIYKYSRNPVYLADLLFILGIAIFMGGLSAFLTPIIFFTIANFIIIPFEEKQLSAVFGEEYQRYCDAVRRWI